ncbi:MAG TPA: AAA family ATPase [Terriglobia bacterium]|nr:AAA family ATPase [Terriglobia bacterium]
MINKILFIKNVGRFVDYSGHGDVEFQKLTLIFGENGRGKTMLSAILRSLGTGDAQCLLERKSIKSSKEPEACIRVNSASHTFKNGNWDNPVPELEVFDTTFINENVYSGVYVDHEHRKNLYRFIVGKKGVQLANAVDDLDTKSRDKSEEIKSKGKEIQQNILGAMSVEQFVSLPFVPDVDKQIGEKEAEVEALRQATSIANKPGLTKLSLPKIPLANLQSLLTKTVGDVADTAEKLVRQHVASCMNERGETWINSGLDYVKADRCPFCGQSLAGVELIKAYRAFFSKAYAALKHEISQMISVVGAGFSQEAILKVQQTIDSNSSNAEFWKGHVKADYPLIEFDKVQSAWVNLHSGVEQHLKRKEASPLETIELGDDLKQAITAFNGLAETVSIYNKNVEAANGLIDQMKKRTTGASQDVVNKELEELKNARMRHGDAKARKLCDEYNQVLGEKETLSNKKQQANRDLKHYAEQVLAKYETNINKHLDDFGATFKICNTGTKLTGGKPSTDYQLSINDTPVNLGDSKSSVGGPCFKNTLSAGDKSTLALAFFIARLEGDPNLPERIVVLDDPVSSLDPSRRTCTQQVIRGLTQKVKQVVVLSHDSHFLLSIWTEEGQSDVKNLQIIRTGQESALEEWDIEKATRDAYLQDYFAIDEYLEKGATGDLRHIACCIRRLIEANLRLRFPKHFGRSEWLGNFIDKIRSASANHMLSLVQPKLTELEALNDYSKKYHHGQNPTGWNSEPINDLELQSYGKRALNFVSGA